MSDLIWSNKCIKQIFYLAISSILQRKNLFSGRDFEEVNEFLFRHQFIL